jgi:hypothetical protein
MTYSGFIMIGIGLLALLVLGGMLTKMTNTAKPARNKVIIKQKPPQSIKQMEKDLKKHSASFDNALMTTQKATRAAFKESIKSKSGRDYVVVPPPKQPESQPKDFASAQPVGPKPRSLSRENDIQKSPSRTLQSAKVSSADKASGAARSPPKTPLTAPQVTQQSDSETNEAPLQVAPAGPPPREPLEAQSSSFSK